MIDGRCYYCCRALTGLNVHRDHLIPRAFGGLDTIENIALTCSRCNLQKKTKTAEEYALLLLSYVQPTKPELPPKTVRMTVWFPEALDASIQAYARQHGSNFSKLVRETLISRYGLLHLTAEQREETRP